jgi:hypothetical protein
MPLSHVRLTDCDAVLNHSQKADHGQSDAVFTVLVCRTDMYSVTNEYIYIYIYIYYTYIHTV